MKCPKKHVKDIFFTWFHMHKILRCLKIGEFHFRFLFSFKIDHVSIIWNAPFLNVRKLWNDPFFLLDSENGENGASQIFRTYKNGTFYITSRSWYMHVELDNASNTKIPPRRGLSQAVLYFKYSEINRPQDTV